MTAVVTPVVYVAFPSRFVRGSDGTTLCLLLATAGFLTDGLTSGSRYT